MPGFMTLQAYCEQCNQTHEVYADELFEFDCRCEVCDSLLVLQEDETPQPLQGVSEQPTKSDTEYPDDLEDLIAEAANRPTTADTDDPYTLAAQALDSSIGFLTRSDSDSDPPMHALSALGTLPDEPPLPSWDGGDTQQVRELAKRQPGPSQRPSLAETGFGIPGEVVAPSEQPLPELDELVEVVHLSSGATMGRGSRTYDKDQLLAEAAGVEIDAVEAYLEEPAGPDVPTTAPPAPGPASAGANGKVNGDSQLFPKDLDWLALMDDILPDDTDARGESEEGKARVYIRMPEELAPQSDDDIEALKQTMATLESSGAAGLEAMLLGGSAREAKRYVVEDTKVGTTDQATQPFQRGDELKGHGELDLLRVDDETRNYRAAAAAAAQELEEEGEDGRTQAWSKSDSKTPKKISRPAARPAAPLRPSSSRSISRPTPRKVVEEFRRAELDAGLVCARDVNSLEADYFRQLYQQIFHARNGSSPRVVLVTSARAKEGKTTIAANLAIVAARIPGRGGVLVDADPRGRGVLRAFGQRATAEGLLESLQTSKDPAEYVLQFSLGALDVVPLGVPSSDAAELIASDRMGDALDSLRGTYADSTIIVDGSAVLHSADPLVLARLVDGVVLVVRAGVTPRREVQRVLDLLGPDRVLGVVLNDADEE